MFDVVAAHEHQPSAIIDSCGVGYRETDLPVAPAGNECSTRHPPQYREYQQKQGDDQNEQKNKSHYGGSAFANNSGKPSVHDKLSLCVLRAQNLFPDMGFEALLYATLVRAIVSRNPNAVSACVVRIATRDIGCSKSEFVRNRGIIAVM